MNALHSALSCLEKQHQVDFFIQTTCVSAPSKQEKNFAYYIEPILKEMGFSISYDNANQAFGGNCGNLIAYWPGTDPEIEPLLFSGHMDTIADTGKLKPILKDGVILADGTSILGADDRSAISSYIEAVRAVQKSGMPCGPIELLFTTNEQGGLRGAEHLDKNKVRSRFGYVFDNPGDVGQVIDKAPYWQAFNIWFRMKCGPEGGHIAERSDVPNAFMMGMMAYNNMELGYLDEHNTVVQIGLMHGGKSSSVIPGELYMRGEIRAYKKEDLDRRLEQIRSVCEKAVFNFDGLLEFELDGDYDGYAIPEDDLIYRCFRSAAKQIDIPVFVENHLGGTDINFLRSYGIDCMGLGQGYKNPHTSQEYISIENLDNTARLTVALIHEWYLHSKYGLTKGAES